MIRTPLFGLLLGIAAADGASAQTREAATVYGFGLVSCVNGNSSIAKVDARASQADETRSRQEFEERAVLPLSLSYVQTV
jgi:hypothetical protein